SRKIDRNELERISDEMLVRTPEDAEKLKIVDKLTYFDEVLVGMRGKLGIEDEKEEINFIEYGAYNKSFESTGGGSDRIAVIVASGDIISGEGDHETIGSDTFAKEIRDARKNERVKA